MIISKTGTLGAGASLNPNNVWAGSAFEYLPSNAYLNFGLVSNTTQALQGLLAAFYVGQALVAEEMTVPNVDPAIYGANNPILANNFFIQAAGGAGQRVVTTLRNPTAGGILWNGILQIVPAGGGRRR